MKNRKPYRCLISQANICGFSALHSRTLLTTSGVVTFGLLPPIWPGLIEPVFRNLLVGKHFTKPNNKRRCIYFYDVFQRRSSNCWIIGNKDVSRYNSACRRFTLQIVVTQVTKVLRETSTTHVVDAVSLYCFIEIHTGEQLARILAYKYHWHDVLRCCSSDDNWVDYLSHLAAQRKKPRRWQQRDEC